MGIKTAIEYCDSSLNLQMGCDGCELWTKKRESCYAGHLTRRLSGSKGWPVAFNQPTIFPERLQNGLRWPDLTGKDRKCKPWLNGLPRVIFLNDMGDTFTESLPNDWILLFIKELEQSPHIYLILTKRADRMKHFFIDVLGYVPHNFWLGVSVTSSQNVKRVQTLFELSGLTDNIWVSAEPLLSEVKLPTTTHAKISWLVTGGESGSNARASHPDWFRALRQYCQRAGTKFFFKQWGGWVVSSHHKPHIAQMMPDIPTTERAVLGDSNPSLIGAYKAIKHNPERVMSYLRLWLHFYKESDAEGKVNKFYETRQQFNDAIDHARFESAYMAALMIFINKTCFNGLWRVNKAGHFNAPHGKYKNPSIYSRDNLMAVSSALQCAKLVVGDFTAVFSGFEQPCDFVYFDPPYVPLSATSNFVAYTKEGFGADDQKRLAAEFERLTRIGVKCMLSNSNHPMIRELYAGYNIHEIKAARSINCKGSERGKIKELLVTNYEAGE